MTLSEDKYEFEEGKTYKPAVTVKVGTKTLAADEDYYVEYADNKAVGTGKANRILHQRIRGQLFD